MWAPTVKPQIPDCETIIPTSMCYPCRVQWLGLSKLAKQIESQRLADATTSNAFNKIKIPEVQIVFSTHSFLFRRDQS